MSDLSKEDKEMLMKAVAGAIASPMNDELKNKISYEMQNTGQYRKEYLERLTRIESKVDAILMVIKAVPI